MSLLAILTLLRRQGLPLGPLPLGPLASLLSSGTGDPPGNLRISLNGDRLALDILRTSLAGDCHGKEGRRAGKGLIPALCPALLCGSLRTRPTMGTGDRDREP